MLCILADAPVALQTYQLGKEGGGKSVCCKWSHASPVVMERRRVEEKIFLVLSVLHERTDK